MYAEGHLPGAFFALVETELSGAKTGMNGRHPLPEPADFAAFLAGHGVTADTQIVAYDQVGGQYAARLWWMARWIGLMRVAVLDGGFPKWVEDGHPLSADVPRPRGSGDVAPQADNSLQYSAEEILQAIKSGTKIVIDARSPERYRGEVEPIDRIAGRIPSARNRFFHENLNADLTMRPVEDLKREFEAVLCGRSPGDVIHQCGSGVTACANLLAMEYAGLTGSLLYPGSWSEWIADPARPVERG